MTSRQAARKALEKRLARGSDWRGPVPDTLKRSEIGTPEGVFQYRRPLPHKSSAHTLRLGRTVQRKGEALGRLLVYWVGDGWVCVDGHHRLAAYQQRGLEDVPVEVFTGELHEAVKQALLRNTEDKLPVEERERAAAAWGLVTTWPGAYSKSEIAEMAGVSTSAVGNMRRVFEQLIAERPHLDLSSLTWRQAREFAKGNEAQSCEDEDAQIAAIRDKLIRACGPTLSKRPDLLARALGEIDEDLPGALRDAIAAMEAEGADGDTEEATAGTQRLPFPGTPTETLGPDF
ncbi:ParB/RepB/Spo0J family partition protein [Thiobacillus sp.]|uniref:ParB/RepB/Spo0J family partition protein n=1 Tax=Thiobacillus sp. TaxID=924 RepID=UPI0017D09359|nr:ParB/RepB/Spo0J family partition protein [Thiobacillus sp.]MBC2731430.1 ParB/RepB/Spo0J family partition protein [Thiobacillus sp.]MBC2740167.1 ParB/RepB/Spo0J family partition protein [Thiobacillus sp.]MBC2758380.1 ParB/RepB/Spo0J family partition protein [Thiobacillus sp.]